MKKALKVTFGTMLAASMISPAFAHGDLYDNFAVFGVITYTQPSNNGLSVGDLLIAANTTTDPITGVSYDGGRRHAFLEPENEWDYGLGFTYRLPHTHNRLFFSYDHFDDDHEEGNINIRNLGFQPGAAGVGSNTAGWARVEENAHEFRAGGIHDLHFGDRFCLDVLAFLEYDKVKQTVFETQSNGTAPFAVNSRETEGKFRGFGPGLGLMTRWYAWTPATHIFLGMNSSLLYGVNNYRQSFASSDPGAFYLYEPQDSKSLVQKLDLSFGINYSCRFHRELHGSAFDISLGMRYMNMINVFKHGNTAYNPATSNSLIDEDEVLEGFAANTGWPQDWGRWGPFLKVKIGGARS